MYNQFTCIYLTFAHHFRTAFSKSHTRSVYCWVLPSVVFAQLVIHSGGSKPSKHPLPGHLAEGVKSLLQFESTDLLMEQAARVFQPPAKAELNWSWGHTLLNSGICGNRGLERL